MKESIKELATGAFNQTKHFYKRLSFQARLIILTIFGISFFVTVSAFLIIQDIQSNIDRQVMLLNNNLKTTQILAQQGAQVLLRDYKSYLERKNKLLEIISRITKDHSEIVYIAFTNNAGDILCKSKFFDLYNTSSNKSQKLFPPNHVPFIKTSHTEAGKLLVFAEPIQFNSNFFGWVWVGIQDSGFTIVGSKKELVAFLIEIFLLVWIISVIGAIINSLIITQPLRKLEKGAKALAEGRFGYQLPLRGFLGKELGQVVKAFNKMSKRLQQYEESNIAMINSEKNKFESVIMSIADGVLVFDREYLIQMANPVACRLLNISSDRLIGKKANTIWDERTNNQIINFLNNNDNSPENLEYMNSEFVKENKKLKLLITKLNDSNNEHLGTVAVIQDRTKEAEVEAMKQEFISNVSHELRTPITSIKCYVDTLCTHNNKIDDHTKNDFLYTVNEEVDRLSNLVNDVLELSKLESAVTKLLQSTEDIYPSIEYALKSTTVIAEKKSIKIIKEIEEYLPMLYINHDTLERILVNLLSNAIKYTPGNGVVKLVVKRQESDVLFQIIDNGIGIDEQHLGLIFERFYRVENKVHTVKGTGLGLTIVKKSIEQCGGKIQVKSKLGEGSIFEFTLPVPEEKESKLFVDRIGFEPITKGL